MITTNDVVWGYRIILDREPESTECVERLRLAVGSRRELALALLGSEEFKAKSPFGLVADEHCAVITEFAPNVRLWFDLADAAIGLSVARKQYELEEAAFFRSAVEPDQFVLDIGANIGFYTVLAASIVGPGGHVLAFEPVPANTALLERSLRENGFEDRVRLERALVGDDNATGRLIHLPLHGNARNSGGSYLARKSAPVPAGHVILETPMVRLDDLRFERRVDFIKADVEGAEPLVFRGARKILADDRPLILTEINPSQLIKVSGCSVEAFLGEMSQRGYSCLAIGEGELKPYRHASGDDSLRSAVLVPDERRADLAGTLRDRRRDRP
jgi:FkbM family methyltransferase